MFSEKDMFKTFFDYPDLEIEKIGYEPREAKHSYGMRTVLAVNAKMIYNRSKIVCPYCNGDPDEDGKPRYTVHGNGSHKKEVQDIPFGAADTYISFRVPDFECQNPKCNHSFSLPFSGSKANGRKTNRFQEFLTNTAFKKVTFSAIGEFYDVDADMVERWFLERVKELDKRKVYKNFKHLGIDEKTIDGSSRVVILDTSTTPSSIVDIIPGGKTTAGCKKAIYKFEDYNDIETITIDMCSGYISALNSIYPYKDSGHPETGEVIGPRVIIDRFHVSQYLIDAVVIARKTLYERLKERIAAIPDATEKAIAEDTLKNNPINHFWFLKDFDELKPGPKLRLLAFCEQYPEFAQLISIKREFKSIFDTSVDVAEAERRYAEWMDTIPLDDYAYRGFSEFFNTVENHHRDIFNYFVDKIEDGRYSNGPVEARNGVISEVIRIMRGASFEVIRGKVLYGQTRVSDVKKVPPLMPKHLIDPTPFSTALDLYLGGIREDDVVKTVYTIMERCSAEDHMAYNEGCTLEEALQHIRDVSFIDNSIMMSISSNANIRTRMIATAEQMDNDRLPTPVLEPIPQQEFLNRFLYYAAEANLDADNDLTYFLYEE